MVGYHVSFIRPHLRKGDKGVFSRMALLSLQMALGSSSPAAASTLQRLAETPKLVPADRDTLLGLVEQAAQQSDSSKVNRLLELLLKRHFPNDYRERSDKQQELPGTC